MKETLFYLDATDFLNQYGPIGTVASLAISAVVVLYLKNTKKYERHLAEKDQRREYELAEKDKIIDKLERKMDQCEKRITYLEDYALKRLNDSLDHMNDVVSENSKSHYETAAIVNETKGVIHANSEKLIQILEKVLTSR